MPHSDPVNWRPISEMPLITSMIDGALDDARIHLETLTQARTRPHVLDDATIDRSKQVHTEQLEFVDIYARLAARIEPKIGPLRLQIQTAGFGWWRLTGRHGHLCLDPADRGQALRLRGLTTTHMAESFA
jgi:hypothetical protein